MEENLRAGFARLDITAPLDVHLGGYYVIRKADGVLDPLYVNALAFSDGENTAVVLVCDQLGIYGDAAHLWPGRIAERVGLPENAVFLCHTHSHTTPVVDGIRDPSDPMYDAWLLRRLGDAAVLAIRDLTPVTGFDIGEKEVPGVTYVRRFLMKDGHYQTWGKVGDPNIVRPACKADETMRVVRISRQDAATLMLVNFQMHPDNIGGCKYSADYPGLLRRRVEAQTENTFCVFYNGAEGQMIATDIMHGSTGPKGYEKASRIADVLGDAVMAMQADLQPAAYGGRVRFERTVVVAPTKRDDSLVPEAERIIALHEAGRDAEIEAGKSGTTPIVAEAYVLRRLKAEQLDAVPLNVSVVTAGPLAFVGFPGEPFCEVGVQVRAASPYAATFACCHTNGNAGYFATAEAYEQDGYEPRNSRMKKGAAELLTAAAIQTLQTLAAE